MGKLESTVPGLPYPSGRDGGLRTGFQWMKGKRKDDGAEGLWRVGDKLYDLEKWRKGHPGGEDWILLTRGTDITEAFESHHVTEAAEKMLPKFYVRDAIRPRASPFTFKPDGFYRKFKARSREALKDVDFHRSSWRTNLIADSLTASTILMCLISSATQSWMAIIPSALLLSWTALTAHNFLHQRDSFRMYYMDLSLFSSKEWRVTHALSHHMFANTLWDYEISVFEPFLYWLPRKDKPLIPRYLACLYTPLIYFALYFAQTAQRIYSAFFEWGGPELRDAMAFLIPLSMCITAPSPSTAFSTWLTIVLIASFCFGFVGLNAGHHHPDIFHDGDVYRNDLDWGLAELDAVRDRREIDSCLFLVLTNFGAHTLHHLLPSVDHDYLHLCEGALRRTCEEFGVNTDSWTHWELVKGQFQQLGRVQPRKNIK